MGRLRPHEEDAETQDVESTARTRRPSKSSQRREPFIAKADRAQSLTMGLSRSMVTVTEFGPKSSVLRPV
jgi:hypothetical protein